MYSRVVPMPHDKSDEDEKPFFDESLDACNPDNFDKFTEGSVTW